MQNNLNGGFVFIIFIKGIHLGDNASNQEADMFVVFFDVVLSGVDLHQYDMDNIVASHSLMFLGLLFLALKLLGDLSFLRILSVKFFLLSPCFSQLFLF
jgi:hypothetical protein